MRIRLDKQGGMSGGGAGESPVVVGRSEVVIDPCAGFAVDVRGDVVTLPQVAVGWLDGMLPFLLGKGMSTPSMSQSRYMMAPVFRVSLGAGRSRCRGGRRRAESSRAGRRDVSPGWQR